MCGACCSGQTPHIPVSTSSAKQTTGTKSLKSLTVLIYILWLQALIHMIEPHLVPVLHNVIEKLDSLAKLDKKEVKKDLKTALTDVLDIIELIDVPILKLCVEIESRMPSYVKPLAGTIKVF